MHATNTFDQVHNCMAEGWKMDGRYMKRKLFFYVLTHTHTHFIYNYNMHAKMNVKIHFYYFPYLNRYLYSKIFIDILYVRL